MADQLADLPVPCGAVPGRLSNLYVVPPGFASGETFCVPLADGRTLPVCVPPDAGAGDVLELALPPGAQLAEAEAEDGFLVRLGAAEARDGHRGAFKAARRPAAADATRTPPPAFLASPVYGWRFAPHKQSAPAPSPYLTEQQRSALSMQEAHRAAIAREQQRAQRQAVEDEVMLHSGAAAAMEAASRHSAPPLATRIPAAQKSLIADLTATLEQQQQAAAAAQRPARVWAERAPGVAAAGHEATRIAMARQASRDPRGRGHHAALA